MRSLAIKLNKAGERAIKQGHPWVFEQSIEKGPKSAPSGSLCVLFDQRTNQPFAFGLWDENETIRIKIIHRGSKINFNQDFWKQKINDAKLLRAALYPQAITGWRAINGENDDFPGIILDIYESVGVLKIYSQIWLPYLEELLTLFKNIFTLKSIVIRFSRLINRNNPYSFSEGQVIGVPLTDEKVIFEEYGVKFAAYTISGHKTGFFLDQRPNRKWVQEHSKNKTVLDVFSYVGGFGIHALKGGAHKVVSVDISKQAMKVAEKNIILNNLPLDRWENHTSDAFVVLNELIAQNHKFDIVILDPPAFAKQANEIPNALRQYERLAALGKQLVNNNGYLILGSCSSRIDEASFRAAHKKAGLLSEKGWTLTQVVAHDIDHPFKFEESHYLKTIFYRKKSN